MVVTRTDFRLATGAVNNPDNTIVIVGSALNGPSRVPFQLNADRDPRAILGDSPLLDAFITAQTSGVPNIILYRLNGVHSEVTIKCVTDTSSKDVLKLRTVAASDEYDGIRMNVFPTHIFFPATDYRKERMYSFEDYNTIQQLAYAINADAYYGVIEFSAEILNENFDLKEFDYAVEELSLQFDGGATQPEYMLDRTVKDNPLISTVSDKAKTALNIALFGEDQQDQIEYVPNSMLGVIDYGIILLADIFHDDDPEITKMLGNFCLNKQRETGNGCLAVIGVQPLLDQDEAVKRDALITLSTGEDEEWRKYVQVIVGDSYTNQYIKMVPSAYAFAGSQAKYPYYIMMSNKSLDAIRKLEYEFSKEDVDSLSANGYTCIVASIRKGFVPYAGVSYSRDKSSLLSKPHCVRITNYVSRTLTNRLDSFIGSKSNPITRQEVMDRVHAILGELVNDKIIMEYKANGKFLNGNTDIDLQIDIRPFSEVRSVSSIVTLSVPGGVIR